MTSFILLLAMFQGPQAQVAKVPGTRASYTANLTWTDATNPTSTTYSVERSVSTCAAATSWTSQVTGLTTKSWTDIGIAAGGTYCYRVIAVNAGQSSPPSATAQAVVPNNPPVAVTNLQVVVK